jgi:hypothetical protein
VPGWVRPIGEGAGGGGKEGKPLRWEGVRGGRDLARVPPGWNLRGRE